MSEKDLEKIRMEKVRKIMMLQSMPKEVIHVHSDGEFADLIQKYPDKIIAIDFWAVWCSPCMSFAPIFERLHEEFHQEFIFAKVNVDETQIANRYGITGIPTTLFIEGGKVIHKVVGAMNYEMMKNILLKLRSN